MRDNTNPPPITQLLAEFSSALQGHHLPSDVRFLARHCLLDWLGVTLGGSGEPLVGILRDDALAVGGRGQATLVGWGDRVTVDQAALVNGAASHALDFDDVQRAMMGHPTVPIAPAIFALGEQLGADGASIVTAFLAGFEVECRVGAMLGPAHYGIGFHATATAGCIGAAAASAKLIGLGPEHTAHALGIAATQAAGLKSMFGTMCKPLHAGRAAVGGITSARWAAAGFVSNPEALETEQGFALTHSSSPRFDVPLHSLGESFAIREVLFKYHAACFGTHPAIEATLRLREDHQLRPSDVTSIRLLVPVAALRMCNIAAPQTGLEGKFSLRFTTALALAGAGTSDAHFTDATVRDPTLVSLRDRVSVVPDETMAAGETEVRILLQDGTEVLARADVDRPADDLERQWRSLEAKFRGLAEPVIGPAAARAVVDAVANLDDLPSVNHLLRACVGRSVAGVRS